MMSEKYTVPRSVVVLVAAVCADYDRREKLLEREGLSPSVRSRCEGLNIAVAYALEEVEPALRGHIMKDISCKRGYRASPCRLCMAKNTYYERKRRVVYDIAKKLSLI